MRAPLVLRWLFHAIPGAILWFLVLGALTGFEDGLWWNALLAGALISAATHADYAWQEWRARRGGIR